jgi:hypothetical protein
MGRRLRTALATDLRSGLPYAVGVAIALLRALFIQKPDHHSHTHAHTNNCDARLEQFAPSSCRFFRRFSLKLEFSLNDSHPRGTGVNRLSIGFQFVGITFTLTFVFLFDSFGCKKLLPCPRATCPLRAHYVGQSYLVTSTVTNTMVTITCLMDKYI